LLRISLIGSPPGRHVLAKWVGLWCFLSLSVTSSMADTERWCSDGFEAPAEMTFSFDTSVRMHLRIGDRTESFMAGNSLGKGRNGTPYVSHRSGKSEILLKAGVTMDAGLDPPDAPQIYIFRDRVFWPCQHHHDH
jgi:hypothetical protein